MRFFAIALMSIYFLLLIGCSTLPVMPIDTSLSLTSTTKPTDTAHLLPTDLEIARTSTTTKAPTVSPEPTSAEEELVWAEGVLGTFLPTGAEYCGEYTPVPQKGWVNYPTDFDPVAYVRILTVQNGEPFTMDDLVVEMGYFVKAEEITTINGTTYLAYPMDRQITAYSAMRFQDAPKEIQEKLNKGNLIASMEIVDLNNKRLWYLIDGEGLLNIKYVVDDYIPNPILDSAIPCPGYYDGHPINYSAVHSD